MHYVGCLTCHHRIFWTEEFDAARARVVGLVDAVPTLVLHVHVYLLPCLARLALGTKSMRREVSFSRFSQHLTFRQPSASVVFWQRNPLLQSCARKSWKGMCSCLFSPVHCTTYLVPIHAFPSTCFVSSQLPHVPRGFSCSTQSSTWAAEKAAKAKAIVIVSALILNGSLRYWSSEGPRVSQILRQAAESDKS